MRRPGHTDILLCWLTHPKTGKKPRSCMRKCYRRQVHINKIDARRRGFPKSHERVQRKCLSLWHIYLRCTLFVVGKSFACQKVSIMRALVCDSCLNCFQDSCSKTKPVAGKLLIVPDELALFAVDDGSHKSAPLPTPLFCTLG